MIHDVKPLRKKAEEVFSELVKNAALDWKIPKTTKNKKKNNNKFVHLFMYLLHRAYFCAPHANSLCIKEVMGLEHTSISRLLLS
jgi:hypothetical protein